VAQLPSHLKVSGNNGSDRSKEPSSSNNKHGHGCGRGHGSGIGKNAGRGGGVSSNDVVTDECCYYSKKGHWARECRKKKQDEEVHAVQAEEEDEPTLFMASGTVVEPITIQVQPGVVHLDESKLFVQLGENGGGDSARWILDSGATNHMMGVQAVFSKINLRVHGTVHFRDGSMANIEWRGSILVKCKTGGHKALTGVFYILRLTANIIKLGQLE
jgi:hypothetical protein